MGKAIKAKIHQYSNAVQNGKLHFLGSFLYFFNSIQNTLKT